MYYFLTMSTERNKSYWKNTEKLFERKFTTKAVNLQRFLKIFFFKRL